MPHSTAHAAPCMTRAPGYALDVPMMRSRRELYTESSTTLRRQTDWFNTRHNTHTHTTQLTRCTMHNKLISNNSPPKPDRGDSRCRPCQPCRFFSNVYLPLLCTFPNHVILDFDVFASTTQHWVSDQSYGRAVVHLLLGNNWLHSLQFAQNPTQP
jgi:hypothetical protein